MKSFLISVAHTVNEGGGSSDTFSIASNIAKFAELIVSGTPKISSEVATISNVV